MKLAVNYSTAAADLLRSQKIQLDYLKCPAWPDLVETIQQTNPAYVHFPLKVGLGIRDAVDTETNQPMNWNKVESLLSQTSTKLINLHLSPSAKDYSEIPIDSADSAHFNLLVENLIKDVQSVVTRFGADRVIVENDHDFVGRHLSIAFLPRVISQVVMETGCGFLLDIAHARLAAHYFGMDVYEYIHKLPVTSIREIHITGVQLFNTHWLERIRRAGVDTRGVQPFLGQLVDHLPMTDLDWELFKWSMEQVHDGSWGRPGIVAFEYGGVSPLYEAITKEDVLAEQIPRLYSMVKK